VGGILRSPSERADPLEREETSTIETSAMAESVIKLPMGSSVPFSLRQPPTVSDTTAAAFLRSTLYAEKDRNGVPVIKKRTGTAFRCVPARNEPCRKGIRRFRPTPPLSILQAACKILSGGVPVYYMYNRITPSRSIWPDKSYQYNVSVGDRLHTAWLPVCSVVQTCIWPS